LEDGSNAPLLFIHSEMLSQKILNFGQL